MPPSLNLISPPSASSIISPATSSVKSPDDKSISVPSIVMLSTTTPAFAVTTPLNAAAPAALPSIVKNVVSAPPSVPLKIISASPACASIVILPLLVARVTAASPVPISSAAVAPVIPRLVGLIFFSIPPSSTKTKSASLELDVVVGEAEFPATRPLGSKI